MTAPRSTIKAEASLDNMQKENRSRHILYSLCCGAAAGAVAKTTTAPLDRLKILIQVSEDNFRLQDVPRRVTEIIRYEGGRKLWRGNSATLARIMPYAGIQFTAYEQYRYLLTTLTIGDRSSTDHHGSSSSSDDTIERQQQQQQQQQLSAGWTSVAGAGAGATATVFTYPLDYIRSRMAVQTHNNVRFNSLHEALRVSVAEDGAMSLFRGLTPTLMGIVPYAGTSFAVYETLKLKARSMRGVNRSDSQLQPFERMGSGALAGLVGQSVAYPLDVVRRRMQTDGMLNHTRRSAVDTLVKIVRIEGPRGLFKGLTLNWIKGPIAVSISFTIFDYLKVHFLDPIT